MCLFIAHIHEIISVFEDGSQAGWSARHTGWPACDQELGCFPAHPIIILENPGIQRSQCTDRSRGLASLLPIALNQGSRCFACYLERWQGGQAMCTILQQWNISATCLMPYASPFALSNDVRA